jgi:hypothetical protein
MLAARLAAVLASAHAASTSQRPGMLQPPTVPSAANASNATTGGCADNATWVGVLTGDPDATPLLTRCSLWADIACDDAEVHAACGVTAADAARLMEQCPMTCKRAGCVQLPSKRLRSRRRRPHAASLPGSYNVTASCPWEAVPAPVISCESEYGRRAALSAHVRGYADAYDSGATEDTFFRCPALGLLNGRQSALKALVKRHCEAVRDGEAGSPVTFDELMRRRELAGSEWPKDMAFQHGLAHGSKIVLGQSLKQEQKEKSIKASGLGGFFESTIWPRPHHCARTAGKPVNTPRARRWGTKWVSDEMQIEVRPILKSGSMTLARLLNCLPGGWREVPHDEITNYRVVAVMRPVVDRFSSAIIEVMGRVFTGNCPEGTCDYDRDRFNWTIAQESIDSTAWLSLAQRFFTNTDAPTPTLAELVRAVSDDVSCNLQYYASEHFITQTSLLVQGTDSAHEPLLFTLDEVGETVRETMQSDFVQALLKGLGPARDDENAQWEVASCVAEDPQVSFRHVEQHYANDDDDLSFVGGGGALSNETVHWEWNASTVLDGSWSDIEDHDALTARNITTRTLAAAIRADPEVLKAVCDIYAHDVACFGTMLGGTDCAVSDEPVALSAAPPADSDANASNVGTDGRVSLQAQVLKGKGKANPPPVHLYKALVITDEIDPAFEAQLRSYGLEPSASPPVYTNETCVGVGGFNHAAETGIFKAHHLAWQTVAMSGEPALIMEHDATFGRVPVGDARRHVQREFALTEAANGLNFVGFCLLSVSEDRQLPKSAAWNKDVRLARCSNYRKHVSSTSNDLNSCLDRSRIANPDATCYLPTCATAYILTPDMARWLSQTGACETTGMSKAAPVDTWMFDQCFAEGRPGECRWIDGRAYDKFHPWPLPGAMYSPDSRYFGLGLVVQDRGEYVGVHGVAPGGGGSRLSGTLQLAANFSIKESPNFILPSHDVCPFRPHNKMGFGASKLTSEHLAIYANGASPLSVVENIGTKLGAGWWYSWSKNTVQGASTPFVALQNGKLVEVDNTTAVAVLGVNEPDCTSCFPYSYVSPENATAVNAVINQYRLPVGSPAIVGYKFDAPEDNATAGLDWLESFMSQATEQGQRVDFIAVHFYLRMLMDQTSISDDEFYERFHKRLHIVKDTLHRIHHKYGKPIWVTEAACLFISPDWERVKSTNAAGGIDIIWRNRNTSSYNMSDTLAPAMATQQQVQNATISLVELFEATPFVHAYNLMNWHYSHRFFERYGQRTNIWYSNGLLTELGAAVASRLNELRWGR